MKCPAGIRRGVQGMQKIITAMMIVCMCMAVLAACGGGGSSAAPADAYRVIVTDESGAPVEGVAIQFCSDVMCLKEDTGADGTAVFETEEGTYTVHVLGVPEGYAEDKTEYKAPESYGDVNITISKAG